MVQTNAVELWKMAADARAKAATADPCAATRHTWRRYSPPGAIMGTASIVLFVVCDDCGRTPQEALDLEVAARKAKPAKPEKAEAVA